MRGRVGKNTAAFIARYMIRMIRYGELADLDHI